MNNLQSTDFLDLDAAHGEYKAAYEAYSKAVPEVSKWIHALNLKTKEFFDANYTNRKSMGEYKEELKMYTLYESEMLQAAKLAKAQATNAWKVAEENLNVLKKKLSLR